MVQSFSSPFSDMLKMGKSKPWPQALKRLTGSETLDVGERTECFEPLCKWMEEQRKEIVYAGPGWDDEDDITTTQSTLTIIPVDGATSLVPVLLNTFACALVALAVFFR